MKIDGYIKFGSPFKDGPIFFVIQITSAIVGMGLPSPQVQLFHAPFKLFGSLSRTLWGKGRETQEPVGIALDNFR
jgi:hypothetical protein